MERVKKMKPMQVDIEAEIRNKMVPAVTVLERLVNNEKVPMDFIKLANRDLRAAVDILDKSRG